MAHRPRLKKMVGIGILHPGEDEFVVPNGVDLAQYPIVDISVQQPATRSTRGTACCGARSAADHFHHEPGRGGRARRYGRFRVPDPAGDVTGSTGGWE
jgi:hypothetical protein